MATLPISAGELDQRITLQSQASSPNVLGENEGAWSDAFSCWAKAEPLAGRDFFAAGQSQVAVDVRFKVRYRADITRSMRVVWRGDPYELVGEPIDVEGGRHTLHLMCVKGIRDGR